MTFALIGKVTVVIALALAFCGLAGAVIAACGTEVDWED